jgi:hypothetical protein
VKETETSSIYKNQKNTEESWNDGIEEDKFSSKKELRGQIVQIIYQRKSKQIADR